MGKTTTKGKDDSIVPKAYERKPSERVLSLKNMYINYARFHMEPTNLFIHICFIPCILFSLNGMLELLEMSIILDLSKGFDVKFILGANPQALAGPDKYYVDPNMIMWHVLCTVYLICDPVIGLGTYSWGMMVCFISNYLVSLNYVQGSVLEGKAMKFFAIMLGFSWAC